MTSGNQPVRDYHDLTVWQKAMDLRHQVHLIVMALPRDARFDYGSQIRRAAFSIPSSIDEGNARAHRQEYRHFLSIARGSAAELDTQLRSLREDFPAVATQITAALQLLDEVSRMLGAMIRKL